MRSTWSNLSKADTPSGGARLKHVGRIWQLILVGLCAALNGCGGSVARQNGEQPATGGAPTGQGGEQPATAGTPNEVPPSLTNESLDAPPGAYPEVPPGSAGFFWRLGLGNWFVTTASGLHHDAGFETIDNVKVWKAGASPDVTDLWVELNHPAGRALDLSAYSGIAFDVRVVDGAAPLVVVFNARGDVAAEPLASVEQRFAAAAAWQSFEVDFASAGLASTNIASIDFIASPSASLDLQVRKLALKCKAACP